MLTDRWPTPPVEAMNMDAKALLLLIVGGAGVAKVIWNLYLSPLARQRLPGPKRAAVAEIWDYWSQLHQRRSLNIHGLFEVRASLEWSSNTLADTLFSVMGQWLELGQTASPFATQTS